MPLEGKIVQDGWPQQLPHLQCGFIALTFTARRSPMQVRGPFKSWRASRWDSASYLHGRSAVLRQPAKQFVAAWLIRVSIFIATSD